MQHHVGVADIAQKAHDLAAPEGGIGGRNAEIQCHLVEAIASEGDRFILPTLTTLSQRTLIGHLTVLRVPAVLSNLSFADAVYNTLHCIRTEPVVPSLL